MFDDAMDSDRDSELLYISVDSSLSRRSSRPRLPSLAVASREDVKVASRDDRSLKGLRLFRSYDDSRDDERATNASKRSRSITSSSISEE